MTSTQPAIDKLKTKLEEANATKSGYTIDLAKKDLKEAEGFMKTMTELEKYILEVLGHCVALSNWLVKNYTL